MGGMGGAFHYIVGIAPAAVLVVFVAVAFIHRVVVRHDWHAHRRRRVRQRVVARAAQPAGRGPQHTGHGLGDQPNAGDLVRQKLLHRVGNELADGGLRAQARLGRQMADRVVSRTDSQ